MRILVVGDGKLGHTLAMHLTREGYDVVVLDNDDTALARAENELDVLTVRGNGANAKALMDAVVDKCDIVIAATATDEVNMLCCLMAKRLGAKYCIARIRDPDYNEAVTLLQRELGIDQTINPERATALEISRLLRYPFANTIENFAKGRVELVEFTALENDSVVGVPLRDVGGRVRDLPRVLYVAVERGGELMIPNGDFIIRAGDKVHVVGEIVTITAYFRALGRNSTPVRSVMLLGGGRISYYLSKLIAPVGMDVTLVEIDPQKAMRLSEMLPEVQVINGDGTDQELLEQEGLSDFDAFVSLGDRDEENLMTGLYAVRKGVKKVVVKNNRVTYLDLLSNMGLDSVVSPRDITCATILRYVRGRANGQGTTVEKVYRLMGGQAEALEFIARAGDPYIGIPIKDLTVAKDALIAVIVHLGRVIVPFGNDHIEDGDSVIVIAKKSGIRELGEVIRK